MRFFLIAGEASGDMHAAGLMRELKIKHPKAEFCFLGGDAMMAVGGTLVRHYRDMAFMGFVNVLLNVRKVIRNFKMAKQAISDFRPDAVILIDYPGFNLRMSKYLFNNFSIPVYYYIAPKVWAWKTYRVRQLKREMKGIITIFPFETAFFARYGLSVYYAGNPSVDAIHTFLSQDTLPESEFRKEIGCANKPYIALLPGSRRQEIAACLPAMLKAAAEFASYEVVVSGAPGIEPDFYSSFQTHKPLKLVTGQTYRMLRYAAAAVVNSGTATLETALLNTPQVVVYHVKGGRLTYWLKDHILKIRYISLVNILMGKEVVSELIAQQMTAENIEAELNRILKHPAVKAEMLNAYSQLRQQLGTAGTADRAASFLLTDLAASNIESDDTNK